MKAFLKKLVSCMLILIVTLASLSSVASADVGGNVDHSASPGGGGSWSSGGGDSWSFGDDSFGSGPSFGAGILLGQLGTPGIIIFALLYILSKRRQGNGRQTPRSESTQSLDDLAHQMAANVKGNDLSVLKEKDPGFSENAFLSRLNNMFIELQDAWTKKDWRRARPYENDQIFRMHAKQLQAFIDNNTTNVVEDINIINSYIESYEEDNSYEYIDAIIVARFRDYIVDDETGDVVKGSRDTRYRMTYRWKLMRSLGTKTEIKSIDVTQCPNCGANLSINQHGVCEYCGSEVTTGNYDWVLTSITPLKQEIL